MKLTPFEDLLVLAESTPFLDKIQRELNLKWGSNIAYEWSKQRSLPKMLQDAGLQMEREVTSGDPLMPCEGGPETARLNAEFRPVTRDRTEEVMRNTYSCLEISRVEENEKRAMMKELKEIMTKINLPIPQPAQQNAPAKSPKPRTPKF